MSQEAFLARRHSLEANEPPVYYALAAAWMDLGRALGATGASLLYFVRALGGLASFALVWLTWRLLRDVYPDDGFLRLGVPILLAFFPQDVPYYVTRDALSPLVMGSSFLLLLRVAHRPDAHPLSFAGVGLLLAMSFLVKYTNVAVFAVAAAVGIGVASARPKEQRSRGALWRWVLLWGVALLPIAIWFARNQLLFGEPTGSSLKIERMGWGRKGFAEIWDHVLFTPAGVWAFVLDLVPSFWRGELAWHREILAWRSADFFYTATSLLFMGFATLGLLVDTRRGVAWPPARRLEAMALLAVLVSVATLAGLSLLFVFHETSNPSAAKPYFDQGRLISGMLVPFAIVYVRGIRVATSRLSGDVADAVCLGTLVVVATVALVSEAFLSWPVFGSAYNWFHLP